MELKGTHGTMNCFKHCVDPNEMAHNEPSHLDLHCLAFFCDILVNHILGLGQFQIFRDEIRVFRWMSVV